MAKHPTTIENDYARKLRKVAKIVGGIVEAHTEIKYTDGTITGILLHAGMNEVLRRYSNNLTPFAEKLAEEMISRVNKNNEKWWLSNAQKFSKDLKSERYQSMNGLVATKLQRDQVTLIKSLPLEAGKRAQDLAIKATTEGRRASDIADDIMRTGDVTASRANTIARTEIAKANATFTQSRAEYVGANNYIWHTMEDENVRESHADMDGQICSYDNPPTLSDGDTINPGEAVNCRCYAEPIIGKD
jgi:SPP1 gp7 family putative phage head morphogenesis protein